MNLSSERERERIFYCVEGICCNNFRSIVLIESSVCVLIIGIGSYIRLVMYQFEYLALYPSASSHSIGSTVNVLEWQAGRQT